VSIIRSFLTTTLNVQQLDPTNYKTVVDLQNEALGLKASAKPTKGKKRKRSEAKSDDDDSSDDMTMQAEIDISGDENDEVVEEEEKLIPLPGSSGIEALRKKLHDRMAELRNRGQPVSGEAVDRDELLEERRRQRAAMRERRRKETKEKIKREEEMKGKKNKNKREEKQKGNSTKVN
jgi:hypothetical protein